MASAAYPLTLAKFLAALVDLTATGEVKARLVRQSAYTYSTAHDFAADLPAAIVTDVVLGSVTVTGGVFDAADATFEDVPAGADIDGVVIYADPDTNTATAPLVVYLEFTGITPNGGDITLVWAASDPKIWKIAA